jgi:hydroxyethylthiazole kinase
MAYFCTPYIFLHNRDDMKNYAHEITADLLKIKSSRPLIHNITNFVVMNFTANALLAVGASPIMAHADQEIDEIVIQSKALVINIGTLDKAWLESMRKAMSAAKKHHIPVIFDPVGVGATHFRTNSSLNLLEANSPDVIRGNAFEIMSLAGYKPGEGKGVDSLQSSDSAVEAATQLTKRYNSVVVISGKEDFIISQTDRYKVTNGCSMMSQVTGMGCTATALIGAFCAINKDFSLAATHAMVCMGIAGEVALEKAAGPGSLQIHFLDALYHLHKTGLEKLRLMSLA